MGKVLAGIVVATAVIGGSAALYSVRHRLFRPDVSRVGGTRIVLEVTGEADEIATVLRRRFDPTEGEGIVIRAEDARVTVDVPNGRRHDANLERVRRIVRRPGRLHVGLLVHPEDDEKAFTAAKAWLAVGANTKSLEDADLAGDPLPHLEGQFVGKKQAGPQRYRWVAADAYRAAMSSAPPGSYTLAREYFPLWHTFKPAGGGVIDFLLLRELPEREGVSNEDVGRPRIEEQPGLLYGTTLILPFNGDGRKRLEALNKRPATPKPERRAALVLDDDVLIHFPLGVDVADMTFHLRMEDRARAEEALSLIRAPLPDGVRVKVVGEEVLPGR
jgi:hypothetical protein